MKVIEFKRKHKKLTVWGNIGANVGATVNINLESNMPYKDPQDIEVGLTNEELRELIKTLQSLVL